MIDILTKLVSINSVFPNEEKCAEFLYEQMISLGFKTEKQYLSENRFNVLAEKGEGDRAFLLYAHSDTVPVYGNWTDSPFYLSVDGDKATGLGSADMKGGIAAILEAVKDFEPKGYKLKVAFGVDEENYSAGAFHLAQSGWLSDVKGVLVPESSLPFHRSEKAGSTITVGRKGRCVFLIKIYGKSAHGVNQNGINALDEGARLIVALKEFQRTESEMGQNSYFVRRFEGKTMSLSVPDYAELELDCHLVTPDTSEILLKKLQDFVSSLELQARVEVSLTSRPTPFLEPFLVDKNDTFLNVVTKAVNEVYGEYSYNYGQSVADENVFGSLGIPTFTVGPLGDNHHSADEWVSLDSLKKLAEIYMLILKGI